MNSSFRDSCSTIFIDSIRGLRWRLFRSWPFNKGKPTITAVICACRDIFPALWTGYDPAGIQRSSTSFTRGSAPLVLALAPRTNHRKHAQRGEPAARARFATLRALLCCGREIVTALGAWHHESSPEWLTAITAKRQTRWVRSFAGRACWPPRLTTLTAELFLRVTPFPAMLALDLVWRCHGRRALAEWGLSRRDGRAAASLTGVDLDERELQRY